MWIAVLSMLMVAGAQEPARAKADEKPVQFITKPGTYKLFDNLIELTIFEMDGKLNTLFKGDISPVVESVRPTDALITKDSGWFIYPANHLEIWIYSGDGELWLYRQDEFDGRLLDGRVFVLMTPEKTRKNKVPQKVLDRLPESVRQKLEDKPEPNPKK